MDIMEDLEAPGLAADAEDLAALAGITDHLWVTRPWAAVCGIGHPDLRTVAGAAVAVFCRCWL